MPNHGPAHGRVIISNHPHPEIICIPWPYLLGNLDELGNEVAAIEVVAILFEISSVTDDRPPAADAATATATAAHAGVMGRGAARVAAIT
jgi:hypothetical protein